MEGLFLPYGFLHIFLSYESEEILKGEEKMNRKLLALFLAVFSAIICFCFASCVNDEESSVTTKAMQSSETDGSKSHTHTYGEWKETKRPTCTEKGEKEQICSCGDKRIEAVNAKRHSEKTIKGYDSTCTETGLTDGKKCIVCGEITKEQSVIPIKHTYVEGICSSCNQKESVSEGLKFYVYYNSDSCSVSKGTCTDTVVYIPSYYNGVPVTEITREAFYDCDNITSIVIPDTVTRIGRGAFAECDGLTSIVIPDSVTNIDEHAFFDCSSLTSITIGSGLKSISGYAFAGCDSLTRIVIPDNIISIESDAFSTCKSLTSVVIPNSVTSISGDPFGGCNSLTIYCEAESQPSGWDFYGDISDDYPVVWDCNYNDIASDGYMYTVIDNVRYALKDGEATVAEQPKNIAIANILSSIIYNDEIYSVTSIGYKAFASCDKLINVVIPYSVAIISRDAFDRCKSLTSIVIPNSVTSMGYDVFRDCSSLTIYCEAIVNLAVGIRLGIRLIVLWFGAMYPKKKESVAQKGRFFCPF